MKNLLLAVLSVSLLGVSGAALAKPPQHSQSPSSLHGEWKHAGHQTSRHRDDDHRGHESGRHYAHDNDRNDRRHDNVRYGYRPYYGPRHPVYYRERYPDLFVGVVLGPHGVIQYVQRW